MHSNFRATIVLALSLCSGCASMRKSQLPADSLNRRMDQSASQAVERIRARKKPRSIPRKPDVPWEDELRTAQVQESIQKEQKVVDTIPVAILRPKRVDAEALAVEDEPTEKKRPVEDSEHAVLEFYREGLARMDEGRWDEAIRAFTKFLELSPEHVYADRAAYWVSHCYHRAGDHGLAVVAANQFEAKYPYSQKIPELILYRGLSHLELGQYEEAIPDFRSILEKYPTSGVAPLASRKLAELRKPTEGSR